RAGRHADSSVLSRVKCEHAVHVLAEDVDLNVDPVADSLAAQRGQLEGGGDESDLDVILTDSGEGQADAVEADRALLHDEGGQLRVEGEPYLLPAVAGATLEDGRGAVDVPLDEVP